MTPYLTSVTTNQMAGYIKEDLEAEGAEVFVIDTANDFAELASRIEDVVSSGTDGIVLVSADPNQAVDVATRQEIHRLLREEAEKGKLFSTSHRISRSFWRSPTRLPSWHMGKFGRYLKIKT